MRFASWVFLIAGVWGFICLPPMYFLQSQIAATSGPITHPEYFYGFVGLALTWQIVFIIISRDPLRWRALMPVGVLEKLVFAVPVVILFEAGKVQATVLFFACIDLTLAVLFVASYVRTARAAKA